MSRFNDTLFSASPFVRWSLSPFLLAFALAFPYLVLTQEPDLTKIIILSGLEILAMAVLLGLWAPSRIGHIAFRIACLIVFLGYGFYLIAELRSSKEPALPRSRAESSPTNALLGLVVIGLPALRYAIRGRSPSDDQKTSEDESNQDRDPE